MCVYCVCVRVLIVLSVCVCLYAQAESRLLLLLLPSLSLLLLALLVVVVVCRLLTPQPSEPTRPTTPTTPTTQCLPRQPLLCQHKSVPSQKAGRRSTATPTNATTSSTATPTKSASIVQTPRKVNGSLRWQMQAVAMVLVGCLLVCVCALCWC